MTILLVLGFVWLALAAFLIVQFHRAPHGRQDENGFHVIEVPRRARTPHRAVSAVRFRHHGMRLSHASFMR